jgi:hypothetical protein
MVERGDGAETAAEHRAYSKTLPRWIAVRHRDRRHRAEGWRYRAMARAHREFWGKTPFVVDPKLGLRWLAV